MGCNLRRAEHSVRPAGRSASAVFSCRNKVTRDGCHGPSGSDFISFVWICSCSSMEHPKIDGDRAESLLSDTTSLRVEGKKDRAELNPQQVFRAGGCFGMRDYRLSAGILLKYSSLITEMRFFCTSSSSSWGVSPSSGISSRLFPDAVKQPSR